MAKFEIYERVDVALPGHQYPIIICRQGLNNPEFLNSFVSSKQIFIVTNHTVASLYLKDLQSAFSHRQIDSLSLEDGEVHKNQQSLFAIFDALIQKKHHRDTTMLALGGGVVGDVAGFAASTYQRGVPLIQIPTTLLAQIDASVGGKTAINHPHGKNLIGSFYQPKAVIIDLDTLNTLSDEEFRAGLAEMIKYGLLAGGEFLKILMQALEEGITVNSPQLPHLIAECCRIKARIVELDEKEESGHRALLNLGHTFAHALEAYTHYKHWLHGEAVAIGLFCAALLSYQSGVAEAGLVEIVEKMLSNAKLAYRIPRFIDLNQLITLMSLDKKIRNDTLPFVLIKKPGFCFLDTTIRAQSLHKALQAAVES